MDLKTMSRAELDVVAAKVAAELASRDNAGWLFYPDTSEPSASNDYCIVHERYWHIFHCLSDEHVAFHVKLPPGFEEVMESTLEYFGDDDASALLSSYGFALVDEDMWEGNDFTYFPPIRENERLSVLCGTTAIKELAQNQLESKRPDVESCPSDWREICITTLVTLAERNGLAAIVHPNGPNDIIRGPGDVCLLENEVYDSLPEYPADFFRSD